MTWKSLLLATLIILLLTQSGHQPEERLESVIVELAEPTDMALAKLPLLGRVDAVLGNVVTLRAHAGMVENLRSSDLVKSVHTPRTFRPALEASTLDIGLPTLLGMTGVNVGRADGRGVLIAVIDTGVDYLHPAFLNELNESRVVYIWDQTIEGKPPEGFNYGYECGPEEIKTGTCPEVDTNGHGTHVASIAAGNSGVARGASLLVVKSGRPACGGGLWTFDEKGILDGLAYAVSKSKALGARLVVNLSLGTDIGAHDGESPLEKALNRIVDDGVVVVVAAGNSASDGRHVNGFVSEDDVVAVRWTIAGETSEFSLSVARHPGDALGLTLSRGGDEKLRLMGNTSADWMGFNISVEEYAGPAIHHTLITVKGEVPGGWTMEVTGHDIVNGSFHMWLESDTCSSRREAFLADAEYEISPDFTVSTPGTAEKVITVGAYMTRNSWRTESGRMVDVGGTVGMLEFYSGRGPTADGRIKPEIVAPGGVILAARSRQSGSSPLNPNQLERAGRGTSMATPHVAGVAAIILQLAPTIRADHVDDVLKMTARADNFTGEIDVSGSPAWGWGKLNADIAYTLSVEVLDMPYGFQPTLSINGTEVPIPSNGGTVLLPKHVKMDLTLSPGDNVSGTRVDVVPSRLTVHEGGRVFFKISTEYYVEVLGRDGDEIFAGWVPRNTVLDLRELYQMGRHNPLSLVRRTVVGYVSEDGRMVAESVMVDKPLTIMVIEAEDYTNLLIVIITSGVATASIYLTIIGRRYRGRTLA